MSLRVRVLDLLQGDIKKVSGVVVPSVVDTREVNWRVGSDEL